MPPNGLALSRAAPLDRKGNCAETSLQKCSDLARRAAASATAPCWTATTSTGIRVAILCRVIVCRPLLVGFGFNLAPKIIVRNATTSPNLFACFVQDCLKSPRVGQRQALSFVIVLHRQEHRNRFPV